MLEIIKTTNFLSDGNIGSYYTDDKLKVEFPLETNIINNLETNKDLESILVNNNNNKELLNEIYKQKEYLFYHELGLKGNKTNRRVNIIADLVMINLRLEEEYSIGFEIKSDKDTLLRLDSQIDTYNKFFDYSYLVVTDKNRLEANLKLENNNCGIIYVDSKNNFYITKEAKKNDNNRYNYWGRLVWLYELNDYFKNVKISKELKESLRYKSQKEDFYTRSFQSYNSDTETIEYKNLKREVYKLFRLRAIDKINGVLDKKLKRVWKREIKSGLYDNYIEIK